MKEETNKQKEEVLSFALHLYP